MMLLLTNLNLNGSKHSSDLCFLAIDEENIFQDDSPTFITGMQDQSAGAKQEIFEYIIDLFVDSQIGG